MRLKAALLLWVFLCLSVASCYGGHAEQKGPSRLHLSRLEFSPLSHAHKHRFRIDKQESSPDKIKTFLGLLTRLSTQLEKNNITYWLDYGTALGVHRGKRIIPWDGDSDLAILKSDHSKVLALKPQIEGTEGEYELIAGPNGEDPESFLRLIHKSSKLYTDIYHYAEEGDQLRIIINSKEGVRPLPRKVILPAKRCELQKKKFYCPRYLKRYLLSRYTTLEANHEWDPSQKLWVEKAAKKGAIEHRYKPF